MTTRFLNIIMLYVTLICSSQTFERSDYCQDHNNILCDLQSSIYNSHRAVFRFTFTENDGKSYFCTGTFINREVSPDQLGYYFITARHCSKNVNFNIPFDFTFNYQSPNCDNGSVPDSITSLSGNRNGERYTFSSMVEKIDEIGLNDMAVLRMVTPPPPQYYVYHAGWSTAYGQGFNIPYHIIHHPQGDIKKYAKTHAAATYTNYTCHTVTKVVDFVYKVLFGWWTKTEIRTETLCSAVESPFYGVALYSKGVAEHGSSGSALFNNNAKIIGVLSGGAGMCDFPSTDFYGRLNTGWNTSGTLRDVLLPNRNLISLEYNLQGRQIECYNNLTLSGTQIYYPAQDYMPSNHINIKKHR